MAKEKAINTDNDTPLEKQVPIQTETVQVDELKNITAKVDMLTPNTPKVKVQLTQEQLRIMSHQAIRAYYTT